MLTFIPTTMYLAKAAPAAASACWHQPVDGSRGSENALALAGRHAS
jgi:hypothetical protein